MDLLKALKFKEFLNYDYHQNFMIDKIMNYNYKPRFYKNYYFF